MLPTSHLQPQTWRWVSAAPRGWTGAGAWRRGNISADAALKATTAPLLSGCEEDNLPRKYRGEGVQKEPCKHPFPARLYPFLMLGDRNKDVLRVREMQNFLRRKALAK